MSTPRELIAAQLRTDHQEFDVKAYPASVPANLGAGKVQVSIWTLTLTPNKIEIGTDLTIEIVQKASLSDEGETQLMNNLNGVLLSVERVPGLVWTSAERIQYEDGYSGYKISLNCTTPNVYKNLVREEQKG